VIADAPFLSRHDVEQQLDRLYRSRRKRHLVAFFGTGETETVNTKQAGRFHVLSVRSELELRERMPALGGDDRIAFLVPWTTKMPLDLAGRFACSGKVFRIGREARLARLFGVADASAVAPEARACPLADYLLRPSHTSRYIVQGGKLTLDAMWAAWLHSDWTVPIAGGLAGDALLGWASFDSGGARFVEAMAAPEAEGVRDALLAYLRTKLGGLGPTIWVAWEDGRGRDLLELAVLFEPLADKPAVSLWLKQTVRQELGLDDDKDEEVALALARALGAAASTALRYVESKSDVSHVREVVRAADKRIKDSEVREALIDDHRLPSAFKQRLENLGSTLERAAKDPSIATVAETREQLAKLEAHELARDDEQLRVLKRAEMAARLIAWLASLAPDFPESGLTPYADVESLAPWYAAEGGYIDWARHWARGTTEDSFGVGVQAVVNSADEVRRKLDLRFARALSCWVEASRPASQVLPIDIAVRRTAVRFVEEHAERKLLVLLLDGMAWAQAVELLMAMQSQGSPWGPLGWHASKSGRIGEGMYPAMLAALPSLTEVSRSAFFAGKLMPSGKKNNSSKDRERWRDNRDVGKLFDGTAAPMLLLRSESHTRDGSASEEALSLIADQQRRIVGIVINAIDSSLHGDAQQRHAWTPESIASLLDLLDKARECGRAVLLVSDHGHVPADLLQTKTAPVTGGARWRPWESPDEALAQFEVGFTGKGVWTPKGAHGVVLISDDRSRYGSSTFAGEHGGATLAEVVAPCVLIGCEDTPDWDINDDPSLVVRPAYVPAWWHLDVIEHKLKGGPEEPKPAGRQHPRKVDDRQMALPVVGIQEPKPAPAPAKKSTALSTAPEVPLDSALPLEQSELFKARLKGSKVDKDKILRTVAYLLDRNGVVPSPALATAVGELSFRIGGFVTKVSEVLNVDGYQVIHFDSANKQVHLDREKLTQLFEVKL